MATDPFDKAMWAYQAADRETIVRIFGPLAEQGNVRAQWKLAQYYYANGSNGEAVDLWRRAAEQGYAPAQFQLGYMYEIGPPCPSSDNLRQMAV